MGEDEGDLAQLWRTLLLSVPLEKTSSALVTKSWVTHHGACISHSFP